MKRLVIAQTLLLCILAVYFSIETVDTKDKLDFSPCPVGYVCMKQDHYFPLTKFPDEVRGPEDAAVVVERYINSTYVPVFKEIGVNSSRIQLKKPEEVVESYYVLFGKRIWKKESYYFIPYSPRNSLGDENILKFNSIRKKYPELGDRNLFDHLADGLIVKNETLYILEKFS
ncbi:Uncharacterised protein [uncultured archaeon]|nr:Uncharacterised protein [uncultured archaeon]